MKQIMEKINKDNGEEKAEIETEIGVITETEVETEMEIGIKIEVTVETGMGIGIIVEIIAEEGIIREIKAEFPLVLTDLADKTNFDESISEKRYFASNKCPRFPLNQPDFL